MSVNYLKYNKIRRLLGLSKEYCQLHNLIPEPQDDDDIEINLDNVDFDLKIDEEREEKLKKNIIKDFKIKPLIKIDEAFDKAPSDILLQPPFSMLMIGRPGSSKSTTLLNLLQWYKGYFDKLFIISPTIKIDSSWIVAMEEELIDIRPENIMENYSETAFNKIFKEIKKKNKGKTNYNEKLKTLFIFDDVVAELPRKQQTNINAFARNHRHYGISHITLSQEYAAIPPVMKKNSFGICLWDSDNELERQRIIEHLSGKIGKYRFQRMWEEAVKQRFSFLFVKTFSHKLKEKYCYNFERFINPYEYNNDKIILEDNEPIEQELKNESDIIKEPEEEQGEIDELQEEENEEVVEEVKEILKEKSEEMRCDICDINFKNRKRYEKHFTTKTHKKWINNEKY